MNEENNLYFSRVKDLTTIDMGNDIRAWLSKDKSRTIDMFAEKAGISPRTVESIIYYDGTGVEPNWTRTTMQGIMKALGGFQPKYHPPHEVK